MESRAQRAPGSHLKSLRITRSAVIGESKREYKRLFGEYKSQSILKTAAFGLAQDASPSGEF